MVLELKKCYKKSLLKFLRILTSFGSILPHNFLTKETNELLAQVSTLIKSTTPKSHFLQYFRQVSSQKG